MECTKLFYTPEQERMVDKLDDLRLKWEDADSPPAEVHRLTRKEYVALALVAGYSHKVSDAVADFLSLDGWTQAWVLRKKDLGHFVGQRIGIDQE